MNKPTLINHTLETVRHSLSHVLAFAVLEMFPEAKLGMGPAIENGFYYDFDLPRTLIPEDLEIITEKMKAIIAQDLSFQRDEITRDKAAEALGKLNQDYKVELVNELPEGEQISFYRTGDKFLDLCRGPHVNKTSEIPDGWKLTTIAGAYWKGDSENKMLQRIYGVAFETQKELEDYLHFLEEAKARDHRKLGKELDLFVFSELVGPGLPLWTPKGTMLRTLLDDFVWNLRKAKGFQKVTIPHITKKDLYIKSGHWSKFAEELFKVSTREGHEFAMKPMNCPHHTQIFASRQRSYRDLPQRYCETTMVYRDEQSGELSGLSRVRCITQDDAHIFCTPDQIEQEVLAVWDIINDFYSPFGFNLHLRLSRHDPAEMEKYLGTPEIWKKAEDQLKAVVEKRGVDYVDGLGEAAMYGPKLDFLAKDSLGREWQVATIQLDFNMPVGLDLQYISAESKEERPVMIHCAIMGSIERFSSVLIEHFAGKFPVWLSPVQVMFIPIADSHVDYCKQAMEKLKTLGIRAEIDDRNETMQAKIRDAQMQKTPYMLVAGNREAEAGTVAPRRRDGKKLEVLTIDAFIELITKEVETKEIW